MKFVYRQSSLKILFISVVITLLTFFKKSTWISPYPTSPDNVIPGIFPEMKFQENIGGGFPWMWWRPEPGLAVGQVQMNTVIVSILSFIGDVIFWFLILYVLLYLLKKLAPKKS